MSDSKIKQILLRVSEDEKKQIEQMAKDNKMSVTAFIKNRVLSNDISESYIIRLQRNMSLLHVWRKQS